MKSTVLVDKNFERIRHDISRARIYGVDRCPVFFDEGQFEFGLGLQFDVRGPGDAVFSCFVIYVTKASIAEFELSYPLLATAKPVRVLRDDQ
jgi:hypothetical protein